MPRDFLPPFHSSNILGDLLLCGILWSIIPYLTVYAYPLVYMCYIAMTSDARGRNRHFDIRGQFLQQQLEVSDFGLSYIASAENPADGGTKPLDRQAQLTSARRLLGLLPDQEV